MCIVSCQDPYDPEAICAGRIWASLVSYDLIDGRGPRSLIFTFKRQVPLCLTMVLREVEDGSRDPYVDSSSNDPTSPTYNPDAQAGYDSNLPGSNVMPIWTVPAVRKLAQQSKLYPNPFTPIPFYARLLGWSEHARDEVVVTLLNRTQLCVDRSLTPVEVEAECSYNSLLYQYLYKFEAIGLASFLGLATLRQQAGKPGLITPYARIYLGNYAGDWCIALSRSVVYSFFGMLQGRIVGALFGGFKVKELARNDPNIQELRKDLASWTETELKRKIQQRREGGPIESITPTTEGIKNRNLQKRISEGQGADSEYVSPQASSGSAQTQSLSAPPPPSSLDTDTLSSLLAESSDNDSPSSHSTSRPGESTWNRIRRQRLEQEQRGSANKQSVWSEDMPRESKTDTFTFSDSDRERQLAQNEAQKDFDSRLEKERKGETGWGRKS